MSTRTAALLLLGLVSCSRNPASIRADERPADAAVEAGVVAILDAATGTRFDGHKRRELPAGAQCLATDALYVREGARVVRFTGSGPETIIEPPSGFAHANEWTARNGWYAWTELDDGGVGVTLHAWSQAGVRSSRRAPSAAPERLHPIVCAGNLGYVEFSYLVNAGSSHAARTDIFHLEPLTGGAGRAFPSGPYVSVYAYGCAGSQPLVNFNNISDPALYALDATSGVKRRLIARPGEWWLRDVASGGKAIFLTTKDDVIERMTLEGGAPTTFYTAVPDERLGRVFASSGVVLVPSEVETSTGIYPHTVVHRRHGLVELDAASGALRQRLVSDGEVLGAFRGDGLAWCTEGAVYSLP